MFELLLGLTLAAILILIKLANRRNRTTPLGAPFVPLSPNVIERIIEHADIKAGDTFYDLGSGDGRVVIAAALKGARAYGVEIDTFRVWYSRLLIALFGLSGKAKILHKNIFDIDLSNADIITAYLLQETNNKLQPKLMKEAKGGCRILGIAFSFPAWKPTKVDPKGPIYGPIYLYNI